MTYLDNYRNIVLYIVVVSKRTTIQKTFKSFSLLFTGQECGTITIILDLYSNVLYTKRKSNKRKMREEGNAYEILDDYVGCSNCISGCRNLCSE